VQFIIRKLREKGLAGDAIETTWVTLHHVTPNAHAPLDDARVEWVTSEQCYTYELPSFDLVSSLFQTRRAFEMHAVVFVFQKCTFTFPFGDNKWRQMPSVQVNYHIGAGCKREDYSVSSSLQSGDRGVAFRDRKIWFRKKLRGKWILVMHATIRCRTFCPLACCQKMWRLEYTRL
jgi:hypothetical protein